MRPGAFIRLLHLTLASASLAGATALQARTLPLAALPEYLIDTWDLEDGLPDHSANAIAQSADGCIWFGTFNGLVRFDGTRFRVFNVANTPELPSSAIINLHLDRSERLWISTEAGLVSVQRGQWTTYNRDPARTDDYARTITEGPTGAIVISTFGGQILRPNGNRLEPIPPPPNQPASGYLCAFDQQETLWAFQPPNRLARRIREEWTVPDCVQTPEFQRIRVIGQARKGGIWVLTATSLVRVQGERIPERFAVDALQWTPWNLYEDPGGRVWIPLADEGLRMVDRQGRVTELRPGFGLSAGSIRSVFQDQLNDCWVGTSGGGLHRLRRKDINTVGVSAGLPPKPVRSVTVAGSNEIIVGTYGAGLARLSDGQPVPFNFPDDPPSGSRSPDVQAVLADRRGWIWIGTHERGLFLIRNGRTEPVGPESLGQTSIYALLEDSDGGVWIGSKKGLARHDGQTLTICDTPAGEEDCFVRAISQDPASKDLWLGLQNRGLYRFSGTAATRVPLQPSRQLNGIRSFLTVSNTLWIATMNAGLFRYRDGRFDQVTEDQGLPSSNLNAMALDTAGGLWLSSARGLIHLSLPDLNRAADSPEHSMHCELFGADGGVAGADAAAGGQPGVCRDTNGNLWFATMQGLAQVGPGPTPDPGTPLTPFLDSVTLGTSNAWDHAINAGPPNVIQVLPGQGPIQISYSAPLFRLSRQPAFETLIKGLDTRWQPAGRSGISRLPALPPGDYQFQVRIQGGPTSDPAKSATVVSLHVQPSLAQSRWFRAIVFATGVVVIAALAWTAAQLRLRRRLRHLQERATVAAAQARLATILENTTDLVAFADGTRNPLYLNRAGRRMLGISDDEDLSRRSPVEMYPPWANDLILREGLPAAIRDGTWRGQTAIRHRSGVEIPVSQVIMAHRHPNGALDFTSTIIRDLTPVLRAQEALRQSESRFRTLFEACPMGIHTYEVTSDNHLVVTGSNTAAIRVLGVENAAIAGKRLEEVFPSLAHTTIPEAYRRAALEGTPFSCEQFDYEDTRIRGCFEFYAFQTAPGRMAVMFQEITPRKQAELALRESEERFRQLAESIHEVFWLVDWPSLQVIYVSPAVETVWNLPVPDVYAQPAAWTRVIHPEDQAAVLGAFQSEIEKGRWTSEYRLIRPDGSIRWVRDRRFAIRNAASKVYRVAGVAEDVTERREVAARERSFRRVAERVAATHSLSDLGRIVARECRDLFRQDAFFLDLMDPDNGLRSTVYAEDTPPGASTPREFKPAPSQALPGLLERLQEGPVCIPVRTADTDGDLGAWGFAARLSQSLIFSPILRDGRCAGVISVQSYTPSRYGPTDADVLQVLAVQCTAAIARLQTEENLRELNRELESKVTERTDELQRVVNLMAGREIRMAELKRELQELRHPTGVPEGPAAPGQPG